MEKQINLGEILCNSFHNEGIPKPTHSLAEITQKAVKNAMKEAVKKALELAAENAKVNLKPINLYDSVWFVNKESILNTINQVI